MTPNVFTKATAAADAAAKHADEAAREHGWQLGEGLWDDEASDYLYDHDTELDAEGRVLAKELLKDRRASRLKEPCRG